MGEQEPRVPGKAGKTGYKQNRTGYETQCPICWTKHRNGSENHGYCYSCVVMLDNLQKKRANNCTQEPTPVHLERILDSWGR